MLNSIDSPGQLRISKIMFFVCCKIGQLQAIIAQQCLVFPRISRFAHTRNYVICRADKMRAYFAMRIRDMVAVFQTSMSL